MRGPGQGKQEPSVLATGDGAALRCHCGSLLARLVPQGVEIKCRRCKRRVVIPLSASAIESSLKGSNEIIRT
jgi:phage FluMu protein Com